VAARALERARAGTLDARARQRRLQVRHRVRELWIDLQHQRALLDVVARKAEVLEALTANLAAGQGADRADQNAVLSSRARRARLDKQRADLSARIADRRAELAQWLDGASLPRRLPLARLEPPEVIALDGHPELAVAEREIDEAEQHVAAARAAFQPGWEAAFGVGQRFGDTPPGAPSDTLINATVSIDLPLFTRDRQSRRLSAARAEREAAASEPIKVRRTLIARRQSARDRYADYAELTRRYETTVIPLAADQAAAEAVRYRNGEQPLEPVLTARLARLEAEYERIELAHDRDRAASELLYLGGK
jgi:outer membrane protein TolC